MLDATAPPPLGTTPLRAAAPTRLLLPLLVGRVTLLPAPAPAADAPRIVQSAPPGTVKTVRQVTFVHLLRALGIEGLTEAADCYGPALALGSARDRVLWTPARRCTLSTAGGERVFDTVGFEVR